MIYTDRVAFVTGAASGIGEAIVRQLAEGGAHVHFCDIDAEAGKGVELSLNGRGSFHELDVADGEALTALIDSIAGQEGGFNILCNNAGMSGRGGLLEIDLAFWRQVMAVDVEAVMLGCRAALPHMRRGGGGTIVNIASLAGLGGYRDMVAYSTAKAAVVNMTRSLALDFAPDAIRVNAVCPGLVLTRMTDVHRGDPERHRAMLSTIPLGRAASPQEIAAAVCFLASDQASYITGCILPVDGGTTAAVRPGVSGGPPN